MSPLCKTAMIWQLVATLLECTLLSHEYFRNKAAAELWSYSNDLRLSERPLHIFEVESLLYIVCTVNFKSTMVHIISKCGFFSCSGKWFVKQELQVSVNIYWVLSTQKVYVKFMLKQQIISLVRCLLLFLKPLSTWES